MGFSIDNITIGNSVFYRKCDGQIWFSVKKMRTDEEIEVLNNKNREKLEEYEEKKAIYPSLLKQYKKDKLAYDIYVAKQKLKEF